MNQLANVSIEIGGQRLPLFSRLRISQWLDQHHTFELAVPTELVEGEGGRKINKSKGYIGQEVNITIKYQQGSGGSFGFRGLVTRLSLNKRSAGGNDLIIGGFSASVLLEQGPRYGAFYKKTHAAIVNKVLASYDKTLLKPDVKPKNDQPEDYVVQFDEDGYRFLTRLAALTGNWFYFDGAKLVFGDVAGESPIELIYGDDISAFDMRMNLPDGKFYMDDWNYQKGKQERAHSADVAVKGLGEYGQFLLDKADALYAERTFTPSPLPVYSESAVKQQVEYEKRGSVADAVVFSGSSNVIGLKVGSVIDIKEKNASGGRGDSYGQYRIVSITHRADIGGSYANEFDAIPAGVQFRASSTVVQPTATPQLARVAEVNDPDHMGRVRVQFLWQSAQNDDEPSTWVRVLSPYIADADKAHYFVPERNSLVMVIFENGDPARPLVTGVTTHGSVKQNAWADEKNNHKVIVTRGGNHIVINDEPGKEEISLYNKDKKNHVQLSLDGTHISIKSEGTINLSAGTINMNAKHINMKADDEWKADVGKGEVSAKETLKFSALSDAELTTQTNLKLAGSAQTSVKGGAQLELEGGAQATLKGALVMIN